VNRVLKSAVDIARKRANSRRQLEYKATCGVLSGIYLPTTGGAHSALANAATWGGRKRAEGRATTPRGPLLTLYGNRKRRHASGIYLGAQQTGGASKHPHSKNSDVARCG